MSAVKKRPYTALPWTSSRPMSMDRTAQRTDAIRVDGEIHAVAMMVEYGGAEKAFVDAGYIAHAANAYPKLVEALRQCYDHLGWNPSKVPAYVAEDARAILKELGEEVVKS